MTKNRNQPLLEPLLDVETCKYKGTIITYPSFGVVLKYTDINHSRYHACQVQPSGAGGSNPTTTNIHDFPPSWPSKLSGSNAFGQPLTQFSLFPLQCQTFAVTARSNSWWSDASSDSLIGLEDNASTEKHSTTQHVCCLFTCFAACVLSVYLLCHVFPFLVYGSVVSRHVVGGRQYGRVGPDVLCSYPIDRFNRTGLVRYLVRIIVNTRCMLSTKQLSVSVHLGYTQRLVTGPCFVWLFDRTILASYDRGPSENLQMGCSYFLFVWVRRRVRIDDNF